MATPIYSLLSNAQSLTPLPAAQVNLQSNTLELLAVQLAELLGAGCFLPTDFNGTIVPSALSVDVSAGSALVGGADARKLVQNTAAVTVTGLTASQTNYVYLNREGTFVSNITGTPPTNTLLVLTCVTDTNDVTSINDAPAARVNFSTSDLVTRLAVALDEDGDLLMASIVDALGYTPADQALENQLVSGGRVVWTGGLGFRVSAAVYFINGTRYESAEQTVTLSAADPSNGRIDVIALNTALAAVVVAGTAAATPLEPDVDPATQLKRGFVTVPAGATAPAGTAVESVYLEDAEWPATAAGSGVDKASTSNPRTGTKCIELTNAAASAYVRLDRASSFDPSTFDTLVLYVRSKATWAAGRSLRVYFRLNAITKGVPRTLATGFYGFDSSVTGSYQQIAIPIDDFAIPAGTLVDELWIADVGGALGCYIDDVTLQGGAVVAVEDNYLTQDEGDARYAQRGSNLSDLTVAATARTNLGLGGAALLADAAVIHADGSVAFGADQSLGSHKLTNVTDPASAQDAATKAYVDALANGFDPKASCRAATTANITLSGAQTIDGVSVIAGNRVLVKNQSSGAENGIYVAASGAWARATDADASAEVTSGMFTLIEEGTVAGGSGFVLTTANPIVLATTALVFVKVIGAITSSVISGAGGLLASNNLSDVADVATARASLALLSMALQAAGAVNISGGAIAGITDLAVADGGTGAGTAGDARTNLGLGSIATQAASAVNISGGAITGITDLAVADGGTGSSTAANARTALGLDTMAVQAANAVVITGGSIAALLIGGVTALTDAATIATDAALGNKFKVVLAGNRTLGNPTNPTHGQHCEWWLAQDGTGTRVLTLGSAFELGTDITAVTLTTTASKMDIMGAIYNSNSSKWMVVSFIKGFTP